MFMVWAVNIPCGDMNLFAERNGVTLQEWVHVLPAVQLTNAANLRVDDHGSGIPRAIAEDETLHVSRTDLAAVVDDGAPRVDEDLRDVQAVEIQLRVSERHEDGVLLGCGTDAMHLWRVGGKAVLPIFLQQRQALLVVDLPHPVDCVSMPPIMARKWPLVPFEAGSRTLTSMDILESTAQGKRSICSLLCRLR
jgi:hypothetical protein